jgi:hypothetical protein
MEVNIGYAWGQLQKAIASGHAEKIAKWRSVIDGMQAGTIDPGSRTPTKAPAWVTLDVVTGGFATGGYAAGGPLVSWEARLAADRGLAATRLALNLYFLEATETLERFERGTYRVDVPEEAALLVVAWLRARGNIDKATELVETLAPWFETLRFYPRLADTASDQERDTVRLQDLEKTRKGLAKDRRQPRFEAQRDAIRVWRPLWDRAIVLGVEGMHGRVPSDWAPRIATLRDDLAKAGAPATRRARETVDLVATLARIETLSESELRRLRHVIGRYAAVHGTPPTATRANRNAADERNASAPLHADLRRVLVTRLASLPGEGSAPLDAMAPVRDDEAARFGVPPGSALPAYLEKKVARSWDASLEELVVRRVIPSGETLASVLPQVTGHVRARTIEDAPARRLYAALYRAFRLRRGLLLLWYQNQVRLHELPWAAALEAARVTDGDAIANARSVVTSASALALRAFPQTMTPNKLVTELYSLAAAAEMKLPLVEELAADIFMGSFTQKFVLATKATARLLAGSLYERYYAIDIDELAKMRVPSSDPKAGVNDRTSPELTALCNRRAPKGPTKTHVGFNGRIIEQAQILTTHNLSVLFDALPLRAQLGPHLRASANACFRFALRRVSLKHYRLAAYAWRQMIFYASFLDDVPAFLRDARKRLAGAKPELRERFEPFMRGLELAAEGTASNEPAFTMSGARLLLGW